MRQGQGNTRLIFYETRKVRAVVDGLLSSAYPARAISSLIARAAAPNAETFERYAGFVLRDAGACELANLPLGSTVLLSPPAEGKLVRLMSTAAIDEDGWTLLADVEDAINRLCCIADAIEDSGRAGGDGNERRVGISLLGAGFLNDARGYHSARMDLPRIGMAERPGLGYFNEIDWRVLDCCASTARAVFQASVLPNRHQAIATASAAQGSDWDVRTRLAELLETLELPLHFGYSFDVDVESGEVAITFTVPSKEAFPTRALDAEGRLANVSGHIGAARCVYALRLCCLLGAAAFGAGKRIGRAHLVGVRPHDSSPVLTCTFERKRYVYDTLGAIDSRELFDPSLRFDASAVAGAISPAHVEYADFEGDGRIDPGDDGMARRRIEVHLDTRLLPQDMRELFHARRICDIDTLHYHGPGAGTVGEARSDSHGSAISAIAHLEQLVGELCETAAPAADEPEAQPLFCSNPLARAAVSLLDDEKSVGDQAEAFLHGDDALDAPPVASISYFRAPDALFHAHMGLSDLYERLGDVRGAEAEADRCIALAPTSASAYFRKSDVLAQQARYAEAANVLLSGLRVCASPRNCALLYYHLALILWNTGRKREAAAVHVYTASLAGEYAEKAGRVVANLRKHDDSPVIVYASPLAAAREMSRSRIPVAPSDEVRALIVKAAIGLSCANAPLASAPYAAALAGYFPNDHVIAAACRSIIHGTAR